MEPTHLNPDWLDDARRHVWQPYTQMQGAPPPIPVVRGEGVWLHTADGRRILDGISSWWVNIHGHANPRLGAALARQAAMLEHAIFAGATLATYAAFSKSNTSKPPELPTPISSTGASTKAATP